MVTGKQDITRDSLLFTAVYFYDTGYRYIISFNKIKTVLIFLKGVTSSFVFYKSGGSLQHNSTPPSISYIQEHPRPHTSIVQCTRTRGKKRNLETVGQQPFCQSQCHGALSENLTGCFLFIFKLFSVQTNRLVTHYDKLKTKCTRIPLSDLSRVERMLDNLNYELPLWNIPIRKWKHYGFINVQKTQD